VRQQRRKFHRDGHGYSWFHRANILVARDLAAGDFIPDRRRKNLFRSIFG